MIGALPGSIRAANLTPDCCTYGVSRRLRSWLRCDEQVGAIGPDDVAADEMDRRSVEPIEGSGPCITCATKAIGNRCASSSCSARRIT